jgi:phosphinothricin acetyltransferase
MAVRMSEAPSEVIIREGERRDLPAINDMYNHYIRETEISFDLDEWTLAEREAWFEDFARSPRYKLLVAEAGGRVIGFTNSRQYYKKTAYDTTVETTIIVGPDERGRGTGSRLYGALFDACRTEDIHRFVAFVTASNEASIAFHAAFGFRLVGTWSEVGRKFGRYWDVCLFERANP